MRMHVFATVLMPLLLGACGHAYERSEEVSVNHPTDVIPSKAGTVLQSNGRGSIIGPEGGWVSIAANYSRRGRGTMHVEGTTADVRSSMRLLEGAGVRRSDMMGVTRRAIPGEPGRVILSWPAYEVRLPECRDFTSDKEELFTDYYHRGTSNLGCSQRRNLGIMISDPGDLVASRGTQPTTVFGASRSVGRVLDYGTYERPQPLPFAGSTQQGGR